MTSSASTLAGHHNSAVEHLAAAAQHHREAVKHHEAGSLDKAMYHTMVARAHARRAEHHTDEAAKAYAQHELESIKAS